MKKIAVIFAILFSASLSSCQNRNGVKDVSLNNNIDSLSYAYGVQMAKNFQESFDQPFLPNDTTARVNKDAFLSALLGTINGETEKTKMTPDEAAAYVRAFGEKIEREQMAEVIAAEEKFLAENRAKEGVIETASGLQYKVITKGTGPVAGENTTVKVHYTGTLVNGTKFDSSVDRGTPFEFNTSGGVIPAWLEIAKLMPIGSKVIIYSPSKLAYGARDMGVIPPYSPLIFEIEFLDIVK